MSKKVNTCNHISASGIRCLRRVLKGSARCKTHTAPPQAELNKECPICLEEGDMYLLTCHHQFHLDCLRGLNQLVCPMCRAPIINLPNDVKLAIEKNGKDYKKEQEEENEQEFMRMIESSPIYRIPPQMEIFLAMRYLMQLGIPLSLIPLRVNLELDPESPLPAPGSIFQNTVTRMIMDIKRNLDNHPEEDDGPDSEYSGSEDYDSEEDNYPFRLEGEDLRTVHSVRTTPSPNPRSMEIARTTPMLFNTMNVILSDLEFEFESRIHMPSSDEAEYSDSDSDY